jgi:Ca2+/H+ antiporter, TMEM165/GDT1 family
MPVPDAVVALTTFAIVFLAELPDKTAIAGLVLGARYRPLWAFAGMASAFTVHVAFAVTVGSLVALLPHRPVEGTVAALFIAGAFALLRSRNEEAPVEAEVKQPTFPRVAGTAFVVIFLAEFGDLTQIVTATFAARYHQPFAVGIGALAALLAASAAAIGGGRALLRVLPVRWLVHACAAAMLVLAGFSLASAIQG